MIPFGGRTAKLVRVSKESVVRRTYINTALKDSGYELHRVLEHLKLCILPHS